ncbi:MAG TPA: PEP-utilizing enzyme [Candidatus Hydrogenedentes bacterium]|nr:PEP-utilizing enzyme [Candidatus Hydrogenedentota bacterium]
MSKNPRRFQGLPVSGGVASGRVFLVRADQREPTPHYSVSEAEAPAECDRLRRAVAGATREVAAIGDRVAETLGGAHEAVFRAQGAILDAPAFLEAMCRIIREERVNAETAVEQVMDLQERRCGELDQADAEDRTSGFAAAQRRLCRALAREGHGEGVVLIEGMLRRGEQRIIVAERLTADLTASLDSGNTLGFITARGGRASHSAMLARGLGIPAISGIKDIHTILGHGEQVLMDGDSGEVTVWPEESQVKAVPSASWARVRSPFIVPPLRSLPVMANINRAEDAEEVVAMQGDGVGLYRTEYEFLAARRVLDEEEQFERYRHVTEIMAERPVYFRLLDFGGDKTAAFLELPVQDNPALGLRGARLLEARPELLEAQARALARLSARRPVYVMYPVIVDCEQFLKLKNMIAQYTRGIRGVRLVHGVMFEAPSACLDADRLLAVADFASIGSNDLAQYLFAVDRGNEHVVDDFQQDRPAFWRVLQVIADAARATGKPVGVCGELGARPECLARLMQCGFAHISVGPRIIGAVRRAAARAGIP